MPLCGGRAALGFPNHSLFLPGVARPKRGHLVAIAAGCHAAPAPPMALGAVVELKHALGALAGAHQVEVPGSEQLGGRERDRHQQLLGGRFLEPLHQAQGSTALEHQFRALLAGGEKGVERRHIEAFSALASRHEFPQQLAQLERHATQRLRRVGGQGFIRFDQLGELEPATHVCV